MKTISRTFFCFIFILTFSSCNGYTVKPLNGARVLLPPVHNDPRCVKVDESGTCQSYSMSIFELLANSEKYHNQVIALGGYVKFEFEGNALFATKEHQENDLVKDAIWLDVNGIDLGENADFREGYAYVSGKFDRFDGGHFRIFSGALKEINFFRPIEPRK